MAANAGTLQAPQPSGASRMWNRKLDHYPENGPRILYLAIVVLATIVLYYELYVSGSVGTSIIQHYGMSFKYFVYISVASNAVGAFSSLIAGAADRYGRANLVTWGLLLTGALTAFAVPNAPNKVTFLILVVLVGFVEGIILVATPALVRDFSPQLGRASAMGFWTLGPVVGSLIVSVVSSNTLPAVLGPTSNAWKKEFLIAGIVGLVVFVIALFGLRELAPRLRDQLMVSSRDRALIEARAQGIDVEASLRHPWRQMLHLDVVGSAFAVSVLLLVYYAAVGFFVIYFTTIYGFSEKQANGIGNWFWAFDAGVLVVTGVLSDRLRVRKPFMIVGGIGAAVMTYIFGTRALHPHTSYYGFVLIVSLLAAFLAIAYAPWMASFTETVEKRNPALTATGLAVWGWVIRAVVAISTFILPFVVSSMTPLVTYGSAVQTVVAQYPALNYIDPTTLAALGASASPPATAVTTALSEIEKGQHVAAPKALTELVDLKKLTPSDKATLTHANAVVAASKSTPHQWTHWWWVCVAGEIVFLPFVLVMAGRWSPRAAKRDAQEHEETVSAEMVRLGIPAGV
jgi:MFS family permease